MNCIIFYQVQSETYYFVLGIILQEFLYVKTNRIKVQNKIQFIKCWWIFIFENVPILYILLFRGLKVIDLNLTAVTAETFLQTHIYFPFERIFNLKPMWNVFATIYNIHRDWLNLRWIYIPSAGYTYDIYMYIQSDSLYKHILPILTFKSTSHPET